MKFFKRIFLFFAALFILILAAAILIPYFYKDEIMARVKDDINKNVNATVDFKDVDLSLIRSFPNFYFSLNDFKVDGKDEFEGTNLVNAENINFTLDLMSVIKSDRPIEIKSVNLKKPNVNIMVLRNGKANYDIALPSEEPTSETSTGDYNFLVELEKYSIEDGQFNYTDKVGGLFMSLNDLDHEGKGNFTQDVYDIFTKTKVSSITTEYGGITYINKAKGDLDITLNANMNDMVFTLKENEIMVNALRLKADGMINYLGDDIKMDFSFNAPQNEFKNFLSLIPSAYTKDFADVKADGQLKFNGFVKGTYNGVKEQYPAFKVNLDVANGSVQYPDLPLGITNIQTKGTINSPTSNFDDMTVDIPNFKMKVGNNPIDASLILKTPVSDPNIDTKINGVINLDELSKAFPMEGVTSMNGLITADMTARTSMSALDRQDYENIDMSGKMQIEKMNYQAEGMPLINIAEMQMSFTPKHVKIDNFDAQLGKSDIKASGTIDNILAYFSPEKTMKGDLVIRSSFFDANEWLTEETDTPQAKNMSNNDASSEVFDRFDFTLDAKIDKLSYDTYELTNNSAKGNFTPNKMTIDNFETKIGNSDVKGSGKIDNVFNYLYENETLGGDIKMRSSLMDLNQFMEAEEGATTTTEEPAEYGVLLIPENMDINVDAKIDKLIYTNMDLKNMTGKLLVKDEKVQIKNASAKSLGGDIYMNGAYDTKNADKPNFDMKYKVKNLSFKEAFEKLNTLKMLAPIGQFIEGRFNTEMSLDGLLGQDMMPDISSLNADGFLHTISGVIKSFKPLEAVGNKLNVDYFNTLTLKDTKNWFTLEDGMVKVKEFPYKYRDLDMKIGGSHSLTQDMDYTIKAKIPRKLIGNNAVSSAANTGMSWLKKEAAKYGANLNIGEFINVNLNVLGSVKDPKIKLKFLATEDGEATVKDVVKDVINNTVETVKDSVKTVVNDKKDDLKKKADAEIAKIMSEAKKQAQKIRNAGKKAAAEAKKLGYAQADKLIKEAGGNIFKKKAAELAANKLKKETDKKAQKIEDEANKKADQVMAKAEIQADKVKKKYGVL